MTPCIPRKATPECQRCMRYAPRLPQHGQIARRTLRIDASTLPQHGVCPMLAQRGLPV